MCVSTGEISIRIYVRSLWHLPFSMALKNCPIPVSNPKFNFSGISTGTHPIRREDLLEIQLGHVRMEFGKVVWRGWGQKGRIWEPFHLLWKSMHVRYSKRWESEWGGVGGVCVSRKGGSGRVGRGVGWGSNRHDPSVASLSRSKKQGLRTPFSRRGSQIDKKSPFLFKICIFRGGSNANEFHRSPRNL